MKISQVKSSFRCHAYGNYGGFNAEIVLFGLSTDRLALLSGKGIGTWTVADDTQIDVFVDNNKIFSGGIYGSFANLNGQPETSLVLKAIAGLNLKKQSASAFSLPGKVEVETLLSAICQLNGYGFQPIALTGKVTQNPYYTGSPMDQIINICLDHQLQYRIFDKVLTVWAADTAVDAVVPLVSPQHGLIGYPVFNQYGITFQTQFSTLLSQGRDIELTTSLPNASGRYRLYVGGRIFSQRLDGKWQLAYALPRSPIKMNTLPFGPAQNSTNDADLFAATFARLLAGKHFIKPVQVTAVRGTAPDLVVDVLPLVGEMRSADRTPCLY